MRLLQHDGEMEEPHESAQIGSSAMPYKRNPMRAERICSLARHVIALSFDTAMTAATQWLERTLDDSANRRIAIPEAFLTTDAILVLLENIFSGLVVHSDVARRRLDAEIPFLATENILMEAVRRGGDRQELHEKLRLLARAAGEGSAGAGRAADMLDRIASDPEFRLTRAEVGEASRPERLTGRSAEQVETFVREELDPALADVEAAASVPLKV
jgi:adenylosuccinate lyase